MAGAGGGADNVSCVLNLNAKVYTAQPGPGCLTRGGDTRVPVQVQDCVGSVLGTLDHESIA